MSHSFVSVNSLIVSALKSILPVAHDVYPGDAKTYATFTTYNRLPSLHSSGDNKSIDVYGDIDVFSDSDISVASSVVAQICTALNSSGFKVRDVRDIEYDGVLHHVLIEFYIRR